MNNHLTGAFVLAALAAPLAAQAEGKIYGQFNISANQVDGVFSDLAGNEVNQDGQSGDNNASRLGFQGENGQFFYAVEMGLSVDDAANGLGTTRHAFVGFNSSYGTFTFGRTNSAYKLAAQRLDPFYDTAAINYKGIAQNEGGSYGQSNLTNGWSNNSLGYISPEFSGVTLNAGIYLQEQSDEDHDYAIGADYRLGDLSLGLQYLMIGADAAPGVIAGSGTDVESALQGTVSYAAKGWSVGASYELLELRNGADPAYIFVGGTFDLSANLTLAATVGNVDQGNGEGLGYTVGAYADLIENFSLYGLFSQSDLDNAPNSETSVFSLGVKYAFEI